ncbi:MAG: succinate dehydrogenase, cytochrome b556 subunit [Pseudomonadales bacterium]|jgi:succinate dehydrogenase / fumarate reductase cytochrome b subunit
MSAAGKENRPVYLSLTQFGWPITAIASIAHRITGMLLFLGVGYLLWLLSLALDSPAGFAQASSVLAAPFARFVLWGVLTLLIYHILAGIKHMIMDFHIGDSFKVAAASSYTVFALSAVLAIITGVWLW